MFFWIIKKTLGSLIKLVWVKRVSGLENIPKNGPVILCANHSSYFDFLTIASVCPRRVYFLAGEVFFEKWQWSWLVKLTKQIKVDRRSSDKSKSIEEVIKYLENGRVVCIFPEGTRSKDGELGDFYNGAVRIALKTGVSIIPIGIKGTFEIMSRFDKLPKFNKRCNILIGKSIKYDNAKDEDVDFLINDLKERIKFLCNK